MGAVISCFDGSLSLREILDIVSDNNPDIDKRAITKTITEAVEFLLKEGFVDEA